jgi:type I restriction enzyme R subunit
MRGRGTRKARNKPVFTLFDFVGVTDFHGDDEPFGEGGVINTPPPRPRSKPRKLLSLDINDHIDPNTRAWLTLDENGNMVFPEASEQRSNVVGARFEAWLLQREHSLTPEQERWLHTVGQQLRANASTWDEFTAGHFAFHPFTLMGGMPEAQRLFGGAGALDDLLESLSAAVFQPDETETTNSEAERPAAMQ